MATEMDFLDIVCEKNQAWQCLESCDLGGHGDGLRCVGSESELTVNLVWTCF